MGNQPQGRATNLRLSALISALNCLLPAQSDAEADTTPAPRHSAIEYSSSSPTLLRRSPHNESPCPSAIPRRPASHRTSDTSRPQTFPQDESPSPPEAARRSTTLAPHPRTETATRPERTLDPPRH